MTKTQGPLAGVRIADFTSLLSGPFATQILGDLNNPQVIQRGMRLEVQSPRNDEAIVVAGDPLRFSPLGRTKHDCPPRLGEHTEEVLGRV
ncbi:hypothetical protein LJR084_007874 [Variovorax sp. LjRoot84]|uniref:hypothetical protein n=1 Tax=Variovorax sp. LjRoot84 TaxID=3342340 RepID=UPI003ECCD48D